MRKIMGPVSPGPRNRDHLWKPGQSGNPTGRLVGTRRKLSERFLDDMLNDWNEHGAEAIALFRTEKPHEYVKVVAGIMPRELKVKVNELEQLSDQELADQFAALCAELSRAGAGFPWGDGAEDEAEPVGELPSLPKAN